MGVANTKQITNKIANIKFNKAIHIQTLLQQISRFVATCQIKIVIDENDFNNNMFIISATSIDNIISIKAIFNVKIWKNLFAREKYWSNSIQCGSNIRTCDENKSN